jgi:hypothetical protein
MILSFHVLFVRFSLKSSKLTVMLGLDDLFQTQGADLIGRLESPLSKIQRGPEQLGTGQDKRQDMNWTGDWTGDRTGTGKGHMARKDKNKATWPHRTGTKRKESRTVRGQTIILTITPTVIPPKT